MLVTVNGMPFDMPDEKTFLNREVANIDVLTTEGKWVKLFDLFKDKPIIISPIYTRCPKACSVITAGLQSSVEELGTLGKDFTIISFSSNWSASKPDCTIRFAIRGVAAPVGSSALTP